MTERYMFSGTSGQRKVGDILTGFQWQQSYPTRQMTFQEAVTYVRALNYGGCTDWRIPSLNEIMSLVDHRRGLPHIDPLWRPGSPAEWTEVCLAYDRIMHGVPPIDMAAFPATAPNIFWTSQQHPAHPNCVFALNFQHGAVVPCFKTQTAHLRCVRGGPRDSNWMFE